MLFQPICGIFRFSDSNLRTLCGKTPRHSVAFSSEDAHINCIPRQIPKTGCFNDLITASKFRARRYFIAVEASPTPGKMTLSAVSKTSALSDKIGSTSKRFSAFFTDSTFPALYFTIAIFIKIMLHISKRSFRAWQLVA